MTASPAPRRTGPLAGLRVFDLSRILAGPTCTQLLGDLGADVIKIERPGAGDDTRKWGPPYLKGKDGDTDESAYYLASNRNKRSVTIDISKPEGQALAKRLIAKCDIMIENFKAGDMARYGLSHADLKGALPGLIYCSISGFGQTGPYAPRAGYDMLAQGIGGLMSVTGEPDRPPMKVGVGIADVMCGMYASTAILAALHHREKTGEGQYIDLALLDTQVAWLVNVGLNYLTSKEVPQRVGNEHPNIVPYNVLPSSDGFIILAVGNDSQFQKFCDFAGAPELAKDPRFATNEARVKNRRVDVRAVAGDHAAQDPERMDRGPGQARRALQPRQHRRPGVRRSAGAAPGDADPHAAPALGRRHGRPHRQSRSSIRPRRSTTRCRRPIAVSTRTRC